MPGNKSQKHCHGSKEIPASIQIANIVKGLGNMVPIIGGFVRDALWRQSKNNKEDMQDLADEIIEIVKIINEAGIQASAMPKGIKYTSSLQTACLEFQEYLSNVLTQVNEINHNKGGIQGKVLDVLASRDIKEDIGRHRKATQLSLNMLQVSLKTLQIVTSNTGTISRIDEQLLSLQLTLNMTVLSKIATSNTQSPFNSETQIMGPTYQMPGVTDPVEDFEELNSSTSFGYCLKLCKERLLQLHTFNSTVPLQHAPYMVAWHQSHHVRMIGFSKVGPAWAVYNALSTKWVKILMDRQQSQDDWHLHGGMCLNGLQSDLHKICKDPHRYTVFRGKLFSMEEVQLLEALQSAIPLQSASYIVSFHEHTCVRMLGFSGERAARAVYGAVSIHWTKVLMDRRHSECEEEVLRYDFQQPT
ncbi:hypothetical protein EDD85DRAFT_794072 [Armillaria nabsnona]|nr:hypothetical protein EDD85DRAFT_794072 [Armillaria nabsnona]